MSDLCHRRRSRRGTPSGAKDTHTGSVNEDGSSFVSDDKSSVVSTHLRRSQAQNALSALTEKAPILSICEDFSAKNVVLSQDTDVNKPHPAIQKRITKDKGAKTKGVSKKEGREKYAVDKSSLIHTDTRHDRMIQDESSDVMKKKGMLKKFYLNCREETVGTLQGDCKGTARGPCLQS